MSRVERVDDGRLGIEFEPGEARILGSVAAQLVGLIRGMPSDPAAQRLFPNGYADAGEQAEFSRYTRVALEDRKAAAAEQVLGDLVAAGAEVDPDIPLSPDAPQVAVVLDVETARPWLTFLTDVRLVIATRLAQDPEAQEAELQRGIYDWTAGLQGWLVEEISRAEGLT